METVARKWFSELYSAEAYSAFVHDTHRRLGGELSYRLAETPVFLSATFVDALSQAGETIIKLIRTRDFKDKTVGFVPPSFGLRGEGVTPTWLALDFAICRSHGDHFFCQLIELQGFPSIYGLYPVLAEQYVKFFSLPSDYSPFPASLSNEQYHACVERVLLGEQHPESVVLLEIAPEQQPHNLDFRLTKRKWGINTVPLHSVEIRQGQPGRLVGKSWVPIRRIYSRVIPEEALASPNLRGIWLQLTHSEVEWACHPSWYYRISKALLPSIRGSFNPECYFLDDFKVSSLALDEFVLKPCFLFGGTGTNLAPMPNDLAAISPADPFVLQRRVEYAPLIPEPYSVEASKVEVRMMYAWVEADTSPVLVGVVARLSRGDHMALRFNSSDPWSGLSVCFLENAKQAASPSSWRV